MILNPRNSFSRGITVATSSRTYSCTISRPARLPVFVTRNLPVPYQSPNTQSAPPQGHRSGKTCSSSQIQKVTPSHAHPASMKRPFPKRRPSASKTQATSSPFPFIVHAPSSRCASTRTVPQVPLSHQGAAGVLPSRFSAGPSTRRPFQKPPGESPPNR